MFIPFLHEYRRGLGAGFYRGSDFHVRFLSLKKYRRCLEAGLYRGSDFHVRFLSLKEYRGRLGARLYSGFDFHFLNSFRAALIGTVTNAQSVTRKFYSTGLFTGCDVS